MADPDAPDPSDPQPAARAPADAQRPAEAADIAPPAGMDSPGKPAILQESHFIVEEGILHRTFRTGAIWLNKLFFSAAALWAIWLLLAYSQGLQDCAGGIGQQGNNSSQDFTSVAEGTCSVLLTTTSKYLGAMTLMSFLGSVGLGLLGLVVGKRVIEMTPTEQEPGAEEHAQPAASQTGPDARGGAQADEGPGLGDRP